MILFNYDFKTNILLQYNSELNVSEFINYTGFYHIHLDPKNNISNRKTIKSISNGTFNNKNVIITGLTRNHHRPYINLINSNLNVIILQELENHYTNLSLKDKTFYLNIENNFICFSKVDTKTLSSSCKKYIRHHNSSSINNDCPVFKINTIKFKIDSLFNE